MEYFTSAMFMVSKIAMIDLIEVQTSIPEKLTEIAEDNKFDLDKYTLEEESHKNFIELLENK